MQSCSAWSRIKVIHVQFWDKSRRRQEMRSSVKLSVFISDIRKDNLLWWIHLTLSSNKTKQTKKTSKINTMQVNKVHNTAACKISHIQVGKRWHFMLKWEHDAHILVSWEQFTSEHLMQWGDFIYDSTVDLAWWRTKIQTAWVAPQNNRWITQLMWLLWEWEILIFLAWVAEGPHNILKGWKMLGIHLGLSKWN